MLWLFRWPYWCVCPLKIIIFHLSLRVNHSASLVLDYMNYKLILIVIIILIVELNILKFSLKKILKISLTHKRKLRYRTFVHF